jgi:perosamine synthetase
MSLSDLVVRALREVLPPREFTPLHEPCFEGNEWAFVKECLDTGWVSTAGKYVDRFEAMLAEFTGAKRAVAVVNGTAALEVALRLAGVAAGDEVLVPALTFVGTANAVRQIGAEPHFVDSEPAALGVDPAKLAAHLEAVAEKRPDGTFNRGTGRRLAALAPVHVFGHIGDMAALAAVAERFGLPVVEDAAEALGSSLAGRHAGTFGKLGTLSFNGNKTITTGGGGAILTDDPGLADLAKHLTTTAKVPHKWEYFHDVAGFNYRLPNLNAALGCGQMELLPGFLARKRDLALAYARAFAGVPGVAFLSEPAGTASNYWLCAILLDSPDRAARDAVLAATNAAGFMTRPAWTLLSKLPMYTGSPRADLSTAEDLESRIINIPSGPGIRLAPPVE